MNLRLCSLNNNRNGGRASTSNASVGCAIIPGRVVLASILFRIFNQGEAKTTPHTLVWGVVLTLSCQLTLCFLVFWKHQ